MRNRKIPDTPAAYNPATMVTTDFRSRATKGRARLMLCLLLLALVVRALIPVGYMPNPGALRDGRIEITFCNTAGSQASTPNALAGLSADHSEHHESVLSAADCPFGMLVHQAFYTGAPPLSLALPSVPRTKLAPSFDNAALPAMGAYGPPLGSRAPPPSLS